MRQPIGVLCIFTTGYRVANRGALSLAGNGNTGAMAAKVRAMSWVSGVTS
jgi:hypothetical protein